MKTMSNESSLIRAFIGHYQSVGIVFLFTVTAYLFRISFQTGFLFQFQKVESAQFSVEQQKEVLHCFLREHFVKELYFHISLY